MTTISVDRANDILDGDDYIATQDVSDHRWYRKQLVVFKAGADLFGFHYFKPATEEQDGQDRFDNDPVPVFPVVGRDIIKTVYVALG